MKKIMILGGSILQLPLIRKAKEMNLYTIVLDYNPEAIGLQEADKSYVVSTTNIEKALKIAEEEKIDSIVTMATDMPMRTVATIGEKMELNTISFDTAMKATDKRLMRNQLLIDKVPIPNFFEVRTFQEFKESIKHFDNKFIVKPVDGSGSNGVVLCDNRDKNNLEKLFYQIKENTLSEYLLVEEYMEGPEVSVETLTINGKTDVIAITDKRKTLLPYFVELGHSIPSTLDNKIQDSIKKVTIAAIKSIGINTGPSHTELIITDDGPKVVEIGARLGGDNITSHLVPFATNVDMVESVIKLSLGIEIDYKKNNDYGAAIRYLQGKKGELKNISNVTDLEVLHGVKELTFTKEVGDQIEDVHSSNDRIGYVIAQGKTVDKAIEICETVINSIEITIE